MQRLFSRFSLRQFLLAILFVTAGIAPAYASLSSTAATPTQLGRVASLEKLENAKPYANAGQKVLEVYQNWEGTRYRLGGATKKGIDCSAFVKTTMNHAFNLQLPRSTKEQKQIGQAISKSELRPGDLVFFRKNNHVGIYIGNGKFVHSSTSQGVITSSLSEKYWAKTYTQSRRVL